jgi:hypothetical protein
VVIFHKFLVCAVSGQAAAIPILFVWIRLENPFLPYKNILIMISLQIVSTYGNLSTIGLYGC